MKLKNLFRKRKQVPAFTGPLQVYVFDESLETKLNDGLGISKERAMELRDALVKALKETDNTFEAIEVVSSFAKHPNELWYLASYWARTNGDADPFEGLIAAILGRG